MSFAAGWPGTNNRRDHQYAGWRMWLQLRPTNRKNKIKRLFNVSR
jgi:hypothetical protein